MFKAPVITLALAAVRSSPAGLAPTPAVAAVAVLATIQCTPELAAVRPRVVGKTNALASLVIIDT